MNSKELIKRSQTLQIVTSNVYDIPQRLREIDPGYFVVFNIRKQKFEVHNTDNIGSSYCFTVPFDELDSRTIQYCKETLVEYGAEKLLAQMEIDNQKIEENQKRYMQGELEAAARESRSLFKTAAEKSGI